MVVCRANRVTTGCGRIFIGKSPGCAPYNGKRMVRIPAIDRVPSRWCGLLSPERPSSEDRQATNAREFGGDV